MADKQAIEKIAAKAKIKAWLNIFLRENAVEEQPEDYMEKATKSCLALFVNILGYRLPEQTDRESVAALVYANGMPRVQEYYSIPEGCKKYPRKVADQILTSELKVLSEELKKLGLFIKEHGFNNRDVDELIAGEMPRAISQATVDKGGK